MWRVASNRVIADFPKTIDAANNPMARITFTPTGYNTPDVTKMTNRRLFYPNGQECTTYTDHSGARTYEVVVNTKNGFINDEQVTLYYLFQTPVSEADSVLIPIHVTAKNILLPPVPTTTLPDNYKTRDSEIEITGTADP